MGLAFNSRAGGSPGTDIERGWAAVCICTLRDGLDITQQRLHRRYQAPWEKPAPDASARVSSQGPSETASPAPHPAKRTRDRTGAGRAAAPKTPDRSAIEQQMMLLLPRLKRFARRLTGNPDDADDLVQSACERALARLEQFEPGTRLDSWLYRICQTISFDRARATARRPQSVLLDDAADVAFDARILECVEAGSSLEQLRSAITALPRSQRLVLALAVTEDMSYKEIAEFLSVPIGTVMSRLSRAREKLKLALTPEAPSVPFWRCEGL